MMETESGLPNYFGDPTSREQIVHVVLLLRQELEEDMDYGPYAVTHGPAGTLRMDGQYFSQYPQYTKTVWDRVLECAGVTVCKMDLGLRGHEIVVTSVRSGRKKSNLPEFVSDVEALLRGCEENPAARVGWMALADILAEKGYEAALWRIQTMVLAQFKKHPDLPNSPNVRRHFQQFVPGVRELIRIEDGHRARQSQEI